MDINFEHYKIFYFVAKYRNITAAAHTLYLSQPSVSRSIAGLESELGCKLFTRSKKGVELTEEGRQLFRHVKIACNHIYSAMEELALMREDYDGVIRLAVASDYLNCLSYFDSLNDTKSVYPDIIGAIGDFHMEYPKIHLKIDSMSVSEALEALHNNVVDAAIVTMPVPSHKNLNVIELAELKNIAIAGTQLKELADKEISVRELGKYSFITAEDGGAAQHFLEKLFHQSGALITPDIRLRTTAHILTFVRCGLGIGLVPESLAQNLINSGKLIKLRLIEEIPTRKICLVTDANYETNNNLDSFLDYIVNKTGRNL